MVIFTFFNIIWRIIFTAMSISLIAPSTTYFEVVIDNELKRFTASLCLAGRSDILRFCIESGIPVRDESQIVTYHIRRNDAPQPAAAHP